jgi:hypothetical protein
VRLSKPDIEERFELLAAALWPPGSNGNGVPAPTPDRRRELVARAAELHADGMSWTRAAGTVGVHRSTLEGWRRRFG